MALNSRNETEHNLDARFACRRNQIYIRRLVATNLLQKLCFDLFYFVLFMPPLTLNSPDSPAAISSISPLCCVPVFMTQLSSRTTQSRCTYAKKYATAKRDFVLNFNSEWLSKLNLFAERIHLEIIEQELLAVAEQNDFAARKHLQLFRARKQFLTNA